MKPIERRRVGKERGRVRDEWNVQELKLMDALTRHHIDIHACGGQEIEELLEDIQGRRPTQAEVRRTLRLATRGKSRCHDVQDLHYALRAQHARRSIPYKARHILAVSDFGPRGAADSRRIHAVLEELNENSPVLMAEAENVLFEAALMAGDNPPTRAELIPAIAAWYLHIERRRTNLKSLLKFLLPRWLPEREYHATIMDRLHAAGAEGAADNVDADGNSPIGARVEGGWSDGRCARCCRRALTSLGLTVAFIFPACFFSTAIYAGAEHGDDRCPKDLTGLITWFGMLGMAMIAVTLADAKLEHPSCFSIFLKLLLAIFPWVGTYWSFHLGLAKASECGPFLTHFSALVWTSLLFMEVLVAGLFFWDISVVREHERALQHTLGTCDMDEP